MKKGKKATRQRGKKATPSSIPSALSASSAVSLTAQVRAALNRWPESQYSICEALGIARSQLSRFARGERELSAKNLNALAAYLGLELKEERQRGKADR